jgi:hypothetical protein
VAVAREERRVLVRADHALERPLGDAHRVLPNPLEPSVLDVLEVLPQLVGRDRRLRLRVALLPRTIVVVVVVVFGIVTVRVVATARGEVVESAQGFAAQFELERQGPDQAVGLALASLLLAGLLLTLGEFVFVVFIAVVAVAVALVVITVAVVIALVVVEIRSFLLPLLVLVLLVLVVLLSLLFALSFFVLLPLQPRIQFFNEFVVCK